MGRNKWHDGTVVHWPERPDATVNTELDAGRADRWTNAEHDRASAAGYCLAYDNSNDISDNRKGPLVAEAESASQEGQPDCWSGSKVYAEARIYDR